MVGITNLVDRAVDWFHVGGMQDIVDPEPEEVFIVSNSDTTARSGISIFQRSLDRTMGIRNRCIVEVTADQYIIGIDLLISSATALAWRARIWKAGPNFCSMELLRPSSVSEFRFLINAE